MAVKLTTTLDTGAWQASPERIEVPEAPSARSFPGGAAAGDESVADVVAVTSCGRRRKRLKGSVLWFCASWKDPFFCFSFNGDLLKYETCASIMRVVAKLFRNHNDTDVYVHISRAHF